MTRTIALRSEFGAPSIDRAIGVIGGRPTGIRAAADRFDEDVVLSAPIVTGDGVALGGQHEVKLHRDGRFEYSGHVRATGWPSYTASVAAVVNFPIVDPGGPDKPGVLTFAAQGRAHGTNESGDRNYSWSQSGTSSLIAAQWLGLRSAQLATRIDYDTDWFGAVGDVVSFVAQIAAASATFGATGAAVVLLGRAADEAGVGELVLPGTVGVLVAAGAAYVFGPAAWIPAFIVGAAVTASTVKQRHMRDDERRFADQVFGGRVPYDRVILTNLVGFGDRPFTAPGPGSAILVNLGGGFDNPTKYTGKGQADDGSRAPGQLLIHELTHVWQISNNSFTPSYFCRALGTAAGSTGGDMSAYSYGPAVLPWHEFGTEQQASIVDEWFAGSKIRVRDQRQFGYPPRDERTDVDSPNANPYFRYIRDNIRTGIS
ncbi:MAG: hypothetical protein QM658_13325 [Gordonia sp. (in: high G+C Gram-positive bacteria)]